MSGRPVRRFVNGLLQGRRIERARPDDVEAQEMKTAIELRAARTGSDSPREDFVTDLHRRLADQMGDAPQAESRSSWGPSGTRRQVVIGTGLAAASAATGIVANATMPHTASGLEASVTSGVRSRACTTWMRVTA